MPLSPTRAIVRTHYTSGTLGGHCASDNRDGGFVFLAHSLPEPSQPLRPAPGPLIQMHEQYSSVLDPRCGREMPGSGPPNKEQGSSIQNSWEFSPTSTTTSTNNTTTLPIHTYLTAADSTGVETLVFIGAH